MFYKTNPVRFSCTGCGCCCYGGEDAVVEVSEDELQQIRSFLGLSVAWFRRRYLVRIDRQSLGIRIAPRGHCVFLDTSSASCRIYPVRPLQCRTYPFWPEVVGRRKDWEQEVHRCEGIGRGAVVPISKIEACLREVDDV
jgi:Fe-S-cluster containining protein